jgi:hypothetical protein
MSCNGNQPISASAYPFAERKATLAAAQSIRAETRSDRTTSGDTTRCRGSASAQFFRFAEVGLSVLFAAELL